MPPKETDQTSNRPFTEIINQHTLQYSKERLQPGQTVIPPTPDEFLASLVEEANGFGINFPGTADSIKDIANINLAYEDYRVRYLEILALPLPSNPTDPWATWYNNTH